MSATLTANDTNYLLLDPTERLSRREAAEILGVKSRTLEIWASTGRYNIPHYRLGRHVFYLKSDLAAFIEQRRV